MSSDSGCDLLVFLLCSGHEAVLSNLERRLHGAGFTDIRATHNCVFRYLGPDGCRLSDLAARAGMTKQAIGAHVDYLEERGYVERVPDPADRRAKLVRPSQRGLSTMRAARMAFLDMEAELERDLGPDRMAAAREALQHFAAARS
jgi:DNA-binding MarR family transcriptional regulator